MSDPQLLKDAREYLALLHKRRALVGSCLGVGLLIATLYNYTTRPLYQATAQVLIAHVAPSALPGKDLHELTTGSDYYETQYALLRGRTLAEQAVERLELQRSSEFQRGPVLTPWERVQRLVGRAPGPVVDGDGLPLSPAVAAFRERLTVEPVPGSQLVYLRFTAYDPLLAAQAVNTLAQLYIEQSLEFQYTTSAEATHWLKERVEEQQKKLEQAESALQQYREREGLVHFEERQGLMDQRLTTLAAAVVNARTERIAKETLLRQMRSQSTSELQNFPLVLENSVVQGLRSRLAALKEEQSRLADTLGARHPEMQSLDARIKELQGQLDAEIGSIVQSVQNAFETAQRQEASLSEDLEAAKREALILNRKSIEHAALKREVESNQQLLRDLLSRTKQTGLEAELKSTNLRIVEKAEVPRTPFAPRRLWNYQLAVILGLGLGVGLALLFEHLDNTVKTPEDVKNQLHLPFLGMIPESAPAPESEAVAPLIARDPQSPAAEAYRVLRTNLIFSWADGGGRVLVVSSANAGEGKTTTVANLAASLAENGARVLAVEADLRRPTMHKHYGTETSPGLSDLIVGKCGPTQAIQGTRVPRLQVLPCGYIPPNPAELLGSHSMREIVTMLRKRYDWVLIDAPPILAMADTPVLCPLADGVILIVWSEHCARPAVEEAVDQVTRVGGKVVGVVLNKVDLERNAYYYSQYYGEYYKSDYAEGEKPRPASGLRQA